MSRHSDILDLPPWDDELGNSLCTLGWPASSSNTSECHFASTSTGSLSDLPQDVIAAGKEVDSIVNELWRTAITSREDGCNNNDSLYESDFFAQCGHNEILLSVSKNSFGEDTIHDVSTANCQQNWGNRNAMPTTIASTPLSDETSREKKSKYKCDKCDKGYAWLNDLVKHQKTHSGKRFSCFHCKKSYSLKSDLSKHQRVHNNEKDFLCKHCGKSFYSMGDLHKHVRIHTGERPYHCNICKKSFSASDNFNKHIKIHSGEKPLSCTVCGQKFLKNGNLQQHRRIHLGEKPFQCDLCGLTFTQKTHMTNHVATHSGLKPFSCLKCDQRFTRNADLNRHCKRAHGDKTGNRGL